VFDWVAVSNTCDFGPLIGDTEREILYFEEYTFDDGYISDGELASVYSEDGTYLADAVLVWPDLYLDYSIDWYWMISYYIEFYGTNEYLTADKVEFFSDVICDIAWQG